MLALLLLLPVRMVMDDDSRLTEPVIFGSDDERGKPLGGEVDKSSIEHRRPGTNDDDDEGCSDEPAGVYRVSRKYKFDHMRRSRTEQDG